MKVHGINVEHNIIVIIEDRRLMWFGHFKRMGSDRIPGMIMERNAVSRRNGKPREQWEDGVRSKYLTDTCGVATFVSLEGYLLYYLYYEYYYYYYNYY